MLVVLIGPRHSGKSTLGPLLAARLRGNFIDLDRAIEARGGRSPRELYLESPETFSRAEARILEGILAEACGGNPAPRRTAGSLRGPLVIAAGGGFSDNGEALALLQKYDPLFVYPEISAGTAWKRIRGAGSLPPFLDTENPEGAHRLLHERRSAACRGLADIAVPAEGKSPETLALEIAGLVGGRGAVFPRRGSVREPGGIPPAPGDPLRRRLGMLLLGAALAVALASLPGGAARPGRGNLVFLQWWGEAPVAEALGDLIREFEELNPGMTVTLDTRTKGEVLEYLLHGGDSSEGGPDILGVDPRWLAEEAVRAGLEGASFDGGEERRSLPLYSSVIVLFYNIPLLEAAGTDRPPRTWEDFEQVCRALGGGALAMALAEGPHADIYPWFWAAGQRVSPAEKPDGTLTEPLPGGAESVAVLRFLGKLYQEGFLPPESFAMTEREKIEAFRTGAAAMMTAPVSASAELGDAGFPFDITTVPGPASRRGRPAFGLEERHAGIPRNGPNKAGSRAFVNFLGENAWRLSAAAGAVPGDGGGTGRSRGGPLPEKAGGIYEAGELPEEPGGPGILALDRAVTEELRRMFTEGRSPEETAAAIRRHAAP